MDAWEQRWSAGTWSTFLQFAQDESDLVGIRDCTYSGRPLGSADFIRGLEKEVHRPLTPQKRGLRSSPDPLSSRLVHSTIPSNPVIRNRRSTNHCPRSSGGKRGSNCLNRVLRSVSRGQFRLKSPKSPEIPRLCDLPDYLPY